MFSYAFSLYVCCIFFYNLSIKVCMYNCIFILFFINFLHLVVLPFRYKWGCVFGRVSVQLFRRINHWINILHCIDNHCWFIMVTPKSSAVACHAVGRLCWFGRKFAWFFFWCYSSVLRYGILEFYITTTNAPELWILCLCTQTIRLKHFASPLLLS